MALATTESTLMHSALTAVSPTLREFDSVAFGRPAQGPSTRLTLASLPTEVLLHIRLYLVPAIINHSIALSAYSLEQYEASTRDSMCPHCAFYNSYVYGPDVFLWHPCGCISSRAPHPTERFRSRNEWLERHLSQNFGGRGIWDVVTEVVGDFDCIPQRRGRPQEAGMVLVVPKRDPEVSIGRLKRDMGLGCDYEEPCPPPRQVRLPMPPNPAPLPVEKESLVVNALDALIAPLTISISLVSSSLTLVLTVLCYYTRPAALRLM